MKRQSPSAGSSPSTTTAENPGQSTTDRRPTCAPIRHGRAFASTRIWVTDATPVRIARARDPLGAAAQHRAAAARIGLPDRHHSAGRHVPGQGRRGRGRGILSRHGFTRRVDLLGRSTAPLYAENAHARFLPDPAKARSRSCSTPPRCRLQPVTPWCNGGPTTPGAIGRTEFAPSRSHRTTRRIETRPHAARSPARRGALRLAINSRTNIGPDRFDLLHVERAAPGRHLSLAVEHRAHESIAVFARAGGGDRRSRRRWCCAALRRGSSSNSRNRPVRRRRPAPHPRSGRATRKAR